MREIRSSIRDTTINGNGNTGMYTDKVNPQFNFAFKYLQFNYYKRN